MNALLDPLFELLRRDSAPWFSPFATPARSLAAHCLRITILAARARAPEGLAPTPIRLEFTGQMPELTRLGYFMAEMDLLEWLRRKCPNRRTADFVHALGVLGLARIEAARTKGYSAGRSEGPERQNMHLSSAASRAVKSRRVQRLREELAKYRSKSTDEPEVATQKELLARLTEVMRSSKDAAVVQSASKLLDAFKRGDGNTEVALVYAPLLVGRLCRSEFLIFQIAGVEYGLHFQDHPSMQAWQGAENLRFIEKHFTGLKMSSREVLPVL